MSRTVRSMLALSHGRLSRFADPSQTSRSRSTVCGGIPGSPPATLTAHSSLKRHVSAIAVL